MSVVAQLNSAYRLAVAAVICLAACSNSQCDESVEVFGFRTGKVAGNLQAIKDQRVSLLTSNNTDTEHEDVVWVRWNHPTTVPAKNTLVLLANGDRLYLDVDTVTEDELTGSWPMLNQSASVSIPLETVQAIIFQVPARTESLTKLVRYISSRATETDLVQLLNGDRVEGEFQSLNSDGLLLESAVGETQIKLSDIRVLAMNPDLVSFPKQTGRRSLIQLVDGSTVTVRKVASSDRELTAEFASGGKVAFPLKSLRQMRFQGGRIVHLTDLTPKSVGGSTFLGRPIKSIKNNRNVVGGILSLRNTDYPLGVGTQSGSRIEYVLDQEFESFHAMMGIDDIAKGHGSVIFRVSVDAQVVFKSKSLTGRSPTASTDRIDIEEAKRLTLEVDFDQRGDILDYANWCDAFLVRKE